MKRNVLHLIGSFHEGGSERQAIQLARLLKESGIYNVHIACMDASGALRREVEKLGFEEIPEFPLTSFYDRNALRQLRRFVRVLRERKIDLVHTHDFYTNIFGMSGAALARTPARIASRRETTGWRTERQKFIERRAYGLAHSILANADAVRDQLISEGVNENKIVTIHNGVDPARISSSGQEQALAAFNLPEGEHKWVTMVANLRHRVKNHAMYLRVARLVSLKVPQARFIAAGEGELMTSLRAMSKELGISDKVFFIGRCDRLGELLAKSDVCVLSSFAEGFSNSILEYMAASRPVVATDVGGAREVIVDRRTGYLVKPDDDVAMAEHIVSLLRDPSLARSMGELGCSIIRERFSCSAQLANTQALYERLLADRLSKAQSVRQDSRMSFEAQR